MLNGKVVKGKALGRSIGFPTANIDIESDTKLIPQLGVYAVNVTLPSGVRKMGMMNIGNRPTVGAQNDVSIEVNLFDFEEDLYGQHITVQLLSRFRDEMKFNSVSELTAQLAQDEKTIRTYFTSLV